ncbi:MAG: hypothetical protein AABY85_09580 [Gemmatimonadota bacterium]
MTSRAVGPLALAGMALLAASALGAQQPRRPTAAAAPAPRAAPPRDPAQAESSRVEYQREVFNFQGGTRDPFLTLITSSEVRPTLRELRLVSILFDSRYGNSVAVVREEGNPRPHRLRRGDQIGRLRVIQIRRYEVVFQVEEFGFERQEVLSLPRPEANNP